VLCIGKGTSAAWTYLLLHVEATGVRAVSLGDARQFLELQGAAIGILTHWQPTRKEARYLRAGDVVRTEALAKELGVTTPPRVSRQTMAPTPNGDLPMRGGE
jgi:hypothetical protein